MLRSKLQFGRAAWFVPSFLLNVLFLGTSHILSHFPIEYWALYVWVMVNLSLPFRGDIQMVYDVMAVALTVLLFLLAWRAVRREGLRVATLSVLQILSASFLPLGIEIFLFDNSEWNLHVAQIQSMYNILPWFTNASLFFCTLTLLFAATFAKSLARLSQMNPLRERRLWEVRRRLHTRNLDIGAGSYPITHESVTLDIQARKNPMVRADLLQGLPFSDGSFDSVTVLEVLEHFQERDQERALDEVYRVLEKGGQLVVTIPYSWGPMRFAQEVAWFVRSKTTMREYYLNDECQGHIGLAAPRRLERSLRRAGFRILEARRLMLYDYLVVAKK